MDQLPLTSKPSSLLTLRATSTARLVPPSLRVRVSVISTEVTYVVGGLVFACIVEGRVWDYAITVSLLHVGLTVTVMADFPSTEHWWISQGSGLVMMIFGGQILSYHLYWKNFVHPADLQNF
ncbi:putative transmembrane protein 244 [Tachysurus vachellii]|uniref:putative transmembrane protein 244 n=1 Tax=Tachysurus vachellii TaxID=175792 RepID=UPI00296AD003|nr:putative transmembrane protein 244 [Tachysurus vachellii]